MLRAARTFLIPLCLGLLCPLVAHSAEDMGWPKYTVSEFSSFSDYFALQIPYFEHGGDASRAREAYRHFGFASFAELTSFLTHPSQKVRWHAMAHLLTFIKCEKDVAKCQPMLARLIQCLSDDKAPASTQWLAPRIPTFPEDYFNDASKKQIKSLLENRIEPPYLILAAGIAKPEGIEPVLEKLRSSHPLYVALAMARLGSLADLQDVLDCDCEPPARGSPFPLQSKRQIPTNTLPRQLYMLGLGYTKQPAAIQKLATYVLSEQMTPGGIDYGPSYTAGFATGVLSMIFKDFPVKAAAYAGDYAGSPAMIAKARDWLKTHYSLDHPLALLNGQEVQW